MIEMQPHPGPDKPLHEGSDMKEAARAVKEMAAAKEDLLVAMTVEERDDAQARYEDAKRRLDAEREKPRPSQGGAAAPAEPAADEPEFEEEAPEDE